MSPDPVGRLRARLRLEQPVRASDELGGFPTDFAPAGEVFGEITPAGAGEGEAGDGLAARSRYRFVLRKPSPVRPGWRLAWGARRFRVATISDFDPAGARLALDVEEEFL